MPEDIETLLSRMPLRRPPAALDAKVRPPRNRRTGLVTWLIAGSAAAAAAAVLLACFLHEGPSDGPKPDPRQDDSPAVAEAPESLSVEREWTHVTYEGVVAPEGEPMAKFRRRIVRQFEWIDPDDGARMQMTVPREDVILIKATVY